MPDPLNEYSGIERDLRDNIERIVTHAILSAQPNSGVPYKGTVYVANAIMKEVKAYARFF